MKKDKEDGSLSVVLCKTLTEGRSLNMGVEEKKPGKMPGSAAEKALHQKKKIPLWLRIARWLYRFFVMLREHMKKGALKAFDIVLDFFRGLPGGIAVLWGRFWKKKCHRIQLKKEKKRQLRELRKIEKELSSVNKKSEKKKIIKKGKDRGEHLRTAWGKVLPSAILALVIFYELTTFAGIGGLYLLNSIVLPKDSVTMVITVGGNKKRTVIPSSAAYPENSEYLYFNMSVLAECLNIATISDGKDVLYTLPCGQAARFSEGSCAAFLDGSAVTLVAPMYLVGGRVYLPLEFLTRYTEGLNISIGDGTITFLQEKDEKNTSANNEVYKEFRFTVGRIVPADLPEISGE